MELVKNVKTHGNSGQNGWTRKQQQTTTLTPFWLDTHGGNAELIPWLQVLDCEPQPSFCARHRGRVLSRWWFATVYDTDCLQPLKQTHGCSLWSSGNRWSPLIPRHQWARPRRRCCGRLPVAPSRAPLAHCASMKRQPAARCCGLSVFCAAVCTNERSSSEHRCAGVQIGTFEVGLGFQEELGEVFGHLVADRALEGSHVRSVQRLCVTCEVPLHVAQFDVWPGLAHDAAKFLRNVPRTTSQGISSASPGRACMSVSIASIMSRRASCVIQCVGEWVTSWRGKSGP